MVGPPEREHDWSLKVRSKPWLPAMALLMACSTKAVGLSEPIVLMWQVTGDGIAADFEVLAKAGVNAVQSFSLSRQPQEYVDAYMDAAAKQKLGVVAFVGNFVEGMDGACALSESGVAFVRRYASHPGLAAWHSVDEPANHDVSKECQRRVYARLKELDPKHPVFLSINFTKQSEYDRYFAEDAFDVLDLHKYVNPHVGRGQRSLVTLFKSNRKRAYPVIVTLRAFNAPGKVKRMDMRPGTLLEQYRFFFEEQKLTRNIGFYGWRLAPNKGIRQIDWVRAEFEEFAQRKLKRPQ